MKQRPSPLQEHPLLLSIFNGQGIANDEVFDEVVDFVFGFAVDVFPLEGVHCTQKGLAVYGEVITVGERDLSVVLGCDANETVYVCHSVKSDFVSHDLNSFLFYRFLSVYFLVLDLLLGRSNIRRKTGAKIGGAFQTIIFIGSFPFLCNVQKRDGFAHSICKRARVGLVHARLGPIF